MLRKKCWLFLLLVVLIGCLQPERPTATPTLLADGGQGFVPSVTPGPAATAVVLPTLLPTRTVVPSPTVGPTVAPQPTATATEAPNFNEVAVEFRYVISGLSLDRHVVSTVGGQITVVDETTGETVVRSNQGPVLSEMQQALPTLVLEEMPADCPLCVQFEYELPALEVSGEGWLTDIQILASVENFTAALVGPHFPPDTLIGLRRNASPYKPAHTIALTADGQLWRWLAIDEEAAEAEPAGAVNEALLAALAEIPLEEVDDSYTTACYEGVPLEVLYLNPDGEGEGKEVRLRCPSLALSSMLLPLYLQLDSLLVERLADEGLQEPEPNVPLASLLQYRRGDGARLTLLQDGTAVAFSGGEEPITRTVSLDSVDVVSMTAALLESSLVRPGIEVLTGTVAANYLVVRAEDGVYTAAWNDEQADEALAAVLVELDALLAEVLEETEEGTGTPTAEAETTGTPPATPTPTRTGTPSP